MSEEVTSFRGRFQWWVYEVGHGCLLLRSPKSPGRPTRIDILFKNVAAVDLPTVFDDPTVKRTDTSDLPKDRLGALEPFDRSVYLVAGPRVNGTVVAGTMVWCEDDGEYHEPSSLM